MYAIVRIQGHQFKVEPKQSVLVNRMPGDEGDRITLDEVLLVDNDGNVRVGQPLVDGAKVEATLAEHLKGDKVIVFKKKRRKGYRRLKGHRQYLTRLTIEGITA